MRKKRVMLIGAGKSGKTTIASWLNETKEQEKKLANIRYGPRTIDVPGAYLECPWMHRHLIGSASDAFCVLMLVDATGGRDVYPPGFAKVFQVPVLGVITKCHQLPERNSAQQTFCEQQLKRAGVLPPYYYITNQEESFQALKEIISLYNL